MASDGSLSTAGVALGDGPVKNELVSSVCEVALLTKPAAEKNKVEIAITVVDLTGCSDVPTPASTRTAALWTP